ncbi:MAG: SurA N-terminal domain-containing protein [Planctomycetota bacterium]|jgi:hypothetical protein|nr:SurA N-terminal domain-containing protein [Planctomycetota bacterium]
MDLFRRNQKIIFWAVTIIIVPSFVAVWGVGGRYFDSGAGVAEIGRVDGKTLTFQEFDAFRKRLQAAVGGLPIQIAGLPDTGAADSELWKYVFAYALLKDAEKADIRVSDLQVGTFLENVFLRNAQADPAREKGDDSQALSRSIEAFCRQSQISKGEFLRGVREWNGIGNYLTADSNLAAINDDLVFSVYSMNKAECVVKRLRVPELESDRESAKNEIMARPPDDLDRDIRAHIRARSSDSRYREPSTWRLAYVLVPYATAASIPQPEEEELASRYEALSSSDYRGKSLEEARGEISAALLREEMERRTLRNFLVDIDPQLRGQGAGMPAEELVKLTQLAKYGVVAGDTGPEALKIPEVAAKLPAGSTLDIRLILEQLDSQSGRLAEARENWKNGFNLEERPFAADEGLFRFRILEYNPSAPLEVDNPEGEIRPEIFELALADLVGERTAELTSERATEMESRLRAVLESRERGEIPDDREMAEEFDRLEEEIIPYIGIPDKEFQLGRLPVGDILGPAPYSSGEGGETGLELTAMVARRLPGRETFLAEPPEEINSYRRMVAANFWGNAGFTYNQGYPGAVIRPSPTVMGGLSDRLSRGEISINREWLQNEGADG